jgi:hypothetical protein
MKVTKNQILKFNRKASREIELENLTGWVSKHKIHPSKKAYTRKRKHSKNLAS